MSLLTRALAKAKDYTQGTFRTPQPRRNPNSRADKLVQNYGQFLMPGAVRPLPLPPGRGTLLMDQGGLFRRAGTPRGQVTQKTVGPLPRPAAQKFSFSPPPLSKRDQSLAVALSKRPRKGN
jgi:hypothetical protein